MTLSVSVRIRAIRNLHFHFLDDLKSFKVYPRVLFCLSHWNQEPKQAPAFRAFFPRKTKISQSKSPDFQFQKFAE
ncbi:hypothetical protein L596_027580 [Steinernema carpocapsae]|uniref:Uncharacterized protein n=1 Tax=Steinernema carpocapsae TaxID=34508 RepID=A0A4U5LVY2_STECR|nr:hypothetical protein L596_027580 [Steinernema carpocapsae]